jgi:hypothetical protein
VDLSDRRAAANQRRPRQEPAEPLSGLYGSSKPRPLLASPKQLVGFRHDALIGASVVDSLTAAFSSVLCTNSRCFSMISTEFSDNSRSEGSHPVETLDPYSRRQTSPG